MERPHRPTRNGGVAPPAAAAAVTVPLARALALALPLVVSAGARAAPVPSKIAFGSCSHEDKPQPMLRQVVAQEPDLFIYLGDNVYGDSRDPEVLRAKYAKLGAKPEFRALRDAVPVLSIWDDHDYGENDAGKEYPLKEVSKEIFLEFWRVPADSPRRGRPGIYGSEVFSDGSHTLQVILLDTRTFRDPLAHNPDPPDPPHKNDYFPDPDPNKTLLGGAQWRWLEAELRRPADLRVVATSIQFAHEYNGWESWTNLPAERQKMVDLIAATGAGGVVFISGDVHWGEISVLDRESAYPLHDVTSSGLTETWPTLEPNANRHGEACREANFGMISIDWARQDPLVTLEVRDIIGTVRAQKALKISELSSR